MFKISGVSRRSFLRSTIGVAAAWELQRAACAMGLSAETPVCNTVAAEQEVGPYYVADELVRSDVSEGKPGLPLHLKLVVLDARTCKPLRRAAVDMWHCDALGVYAGFTKMNPTGMGPGGTGGGPPPGGAPPPNDMQGRPGMPPGPPPQGSPQSFDPQHPNNRQGPPEGMGPPPAMHTTDELTFCRGIQFTDDEGRVEFTTIFPGFYMGRTNHIHFKVREGGTLVSRKGTPDGKTYLEGHTPHIGQVFFPEAIAVELMQHEPYSSHQIHRTTQAEDDVFQNQHGDASLATLRSLDPKDPKRGYTADLIVAVDPTKTPAPAGRGGPGGPPGQSSQK